MRILIQTYGSAGDVHPFVGLGRALANRGHEVRVWANGHFRDLVEGGGLAFRESGTAEEYRTAVEDPDLWHPRRGLKLILSRGVLPDIPATVSGMRDEIREGETILIGSTLGLAARILRDVVPVPLVTAHLSPSAFRSVFRPPLYPGMFCGPRVPNWLVRLQYRLADVVVDRCLSPGFNRYRAELGLPPVRRAFDRWLHSPDLVLGLYPDWFAPPQPDMPENVSLTGFPLFDESGLRKEDPDLAFWLEGGTRPIVFTAGSANRQAEGFFAQSAEAATALGRRALLIGSSAGIDTATGGDDIRVAEYVPFSRVLPRAAALVSHGGIGTCAQALAAGIPHLVVPMAYDQFDNGSRLVDLGAGEVLPASRYRADEAVRRLGGLLDRPEYAARAAELATRVASGDSERETCERIETVSGG